MIRRPPRSTQSRSSAASDVYKRQYQATPWAPPLWPPMLVLCCPPTWPALPSVRLSTALTPPAPPLRPLVSATLSSSSKPTQCGDLSVPVVLLKTCLLYTSPSPRDRTRSRMPSSA
eukprot:TRINITY_DN19274_c0_g1_i1.p1 TRINITY_DN19274_c0_g1~~TRINITY_DN19274_c0_g1_i1.p1  ORF type:complete len:116 (+),score=35.39 TRINITY_DN19274_c0_g1_i1:74-421(+)